MKLHIFPPRWALLASLTAVALQGCASGPQPHPAPVVRAPAPAPAKGQMAPIPNPPEDEKPAAPAVAAPTPPRPAKPAAPKTAPSRAPARPPGTPPAAVSAADAARAAKLRASGLEQLNRGAVDKAVALLQQASQLDPSNELIQHDLERALRISQVVHAKP